MRRAAKILRRPNRKLRETRNGWLRLRFRQGNLNFDDRAGTGVSQVEISVVFLHPLLDAHHADAVTIRVQLTRSVSHTSAVVNDGDVYVAFVLREVDGRALGLRVAENVCQGFLNYLEDGHLHLRFKARE